MKKLFIIFAVLVACNDDERVIKELVREDLIGRWEWASFVYEGTTYTECQPTFFGAPIDMDITVDGFDIIVAQTFCFDPQKWDPHPASFRDGILKLEVSAGTTFVEYKILSWSDNKMVLRYEGQSGSHPTSFWDGDPVGGIIHLTKIN